MTFPAGQAGTAVPAVSNGASLLWFDHFEAAANKPIPAAWLADTTGANQNSQANMPGNATHDGSSHLACVAKSGTVTSPAGGSFPYSGMQIYGGPNRRCPNPGYMEARIQMPAGVSGGAWPTWWTMGANSGNAYPFTGWPACGETDIIENQPAASTTNGYATMHFPGSSGAAQYGGGALAASTLAMDTAWHVWGCWWQGNQITMYRDQVAYWTCTQAALTGAAGGNTWEWSSLAQVPLLSIYVGGAGGGTPNPSAFPLTMLVDWVTCWSKPPFV